ncbi:GGDEF domain-containing protein [Rhizorhabdus argentea]|uniref:GGDEF domain-containing protein n=1 Tax=Rhizorhabdus argentea TaxID=1387174 RepID=UPI0030EFA517
MVHIIALTFIAAMLAAVMLIAWHSFGRPRHALIWAIAFSVATGELFSNLLMRLYADHDALLFALVAGLSCLSNALIAVGFIARARERANLPLLLLAACAAAMLISGMTFTVQHRGVCEATWLFFGGAMLVISAANVARSLKAAPPPERSVAMMLVLFAAIDFAAGGVALGEGATAHGGGLMFVRTLLMLLYPLAFIGVGIFAVFLVAADLAENMRQLATSDILTGIYNRRGFEDAAERAIRNAQRQRQPLAVVVADIDSFKAINDRHGHNTGDRALRHFATRLERLIRRGDVIGRIGGEEFALLLVNTRAQNALDVVERIRRDIAAMPVDGPARITMTASFGVTGLRPGDISLAALLARADRALYRSKLDGRDRVTSAEDLDEAV